MERFRCSIAKVVVEFFGADADFMGRLAASYDPFLSSAAADLQIELDTSAFSSTRSDPSVWAANLEEGGMEFGYGNLMRCRLEPTWRSGTFYLVPDLKAFDIGFRVLLATVLPRFNGLLLHGAAVESGSMGHLFIGPSGAGKSTISHISSNAGKQVLSDEITAVRQVEKAWTVFGTPFRGSSNRTSRPLPVPLAAVYLPKKSDAISWTPANSWQAAEAVLKTILSFSPDHENNKRLFSLTAGLLRKVPFRMLHFTKTGDFWGALAS